MSNFVLTKQHLREVLIFCFNWKKSAAEAHRMLVEVYDDTAPDKSCREWYFDISRMEISMLKTSLALDSQKKFEDKELETLLEEDQESNARACRIIGGNSTSRFCTIESHGNNSKTRKLDVL